MVIVTIVGARPQFIKAAVVSRALQRVGAADEVLVHTGQHYDAEMSSVFFRDLGIPEPRFHLGIGSASHGAQTGRMLEAIESVLQDVGPDYVLVYGDTNSTLAGALAAVKMHIPVAHVEAGLRSFNRNMPEEINRVLTDHIATLLFAPTQTAFEHLRREGIRRELCHVVGDVMFDTVLFFAEKAATESKILDRLKLGDAEYVLATIHRAENTDDEDRLRAIARGLARVGRQRRVVMPLHPRTRNALQHAGLLDELEKCVTVTGPVGYLDMVQLERKACLVVTDSGGVQKEAFFHEVPCVTLRDETEWTELVEHGWNELVPPADDAVVFERIVARIGVQGRPAALYGDGHAADQIARILATMGGRNRPEHRTA